MKTLVRMMLCLMISFTLVEFPIMKSHAQAGMISTGDALTEMARQDHQNKVQAFMSRDDVKAQFVKLGVSPEEAALRVASLNDKELKKLSSEIDNSTAGGDIGGVLVLVLIVVLIIYLVKRI